MDHKYTKQVNVPILGMININFFGASKDIIDLYELVNEFNRQKNIKHLGLISVVFDSVTHTRFDYVMLQCALVDVLDKFHSSESIYNIGSLKINGDSVFGTTIIKSWFLLSNFGHAKNTVGDEKALAQYLLTNKIARKCIIEKIKDTDLKKFAKKVIAEFDYMRLHYVLGIARVYEEVNSTNLKRNIINLYRLLLLDDEILKKDFNVLKVNVLRSIYNKIRELSIIAIDSHYSHIPFSINLLSTVINLNEAEASENNLLNSILGALNHDLYLNSSVLCIQQTYSKEAQECLNTATDIENVLFKQIFHNGLVNNLNEEYEPLTRITIDEKIQVSSNILEYLYELENKFQDPDVMVNVDKNPYFNEIYIDILIKKDIDLDKFPKITFSIFEYLEAQLKNMLVVNDGNIFVLRNKLEDLNLEQDKMEILDNLIYKPLSLNKIYIAELNKMFEKVFWDVIKHFIKPKYRIQTNKKNLRYKHFSMKLLNKILNQNQLDITEAKVHLKDDPDRIHELDHLEYGLKRDFNGYVLYLIERSTVYDLTKPPSNRITTDIDSLIMKVNNETLIIEFNESKNTRNRENVAFKDLKNKFTRILNKNAKGYKTLRVTNFGAKVRIKI